MEEDPFFDDDFTQTRRSSKRSHEQMLSALSQSSGANLSCFTTVPRHAPSASLNQNFPPPPITRYPGDGLDGRYPAMSRSMPPHADIIDLTDDADVPPEPPPPRTRDVNTTQRPYHARDTYDVIDLADQDDLDDTNHLFEDDDGSSDVEIVGSNTINRSAPQPSSFPERMPSFNNTSAQLDHGPQTRGTWYPFGGFLQHMAPVRSLVRSRQNSGRDGVGITTVQFATPVAGGDFSDGHRFRPTGFQFPTLNFETTAFPIARQEPAPRAAPPTYTAPPEPAEGFTRTLREEDVAICPNCETELGIGEEELQRQIWVIKSCGHVYCGQCAKNRHKKSMKTYSAARPFAKCVVDGCGRVKISGPKAMIQIYI